MSITTFYGDVRATWGERTLTLAQEGGSVATIRYAAIAAVEASTTFGHNVFIGLRGKDHAYSVIHDSEAESMEFAATLAGHMERSES